MALTLTNMQDEIRAITRRDSTAFSDTRLNYYINWAQRWVADVHTFEEMFILDTATYSTTTNLQTYSFPTRMKDIYSIRLIDGSNSLKLTYVYPRHFDDAHPYPESDTTGKPEWYVDYGTIYELYPIPDAAYHLEIRYSRFPADLSGATDVSALDNKDRLIICKASAFVLRTVRELDDAEYWEGEADRELLAKLETDHSGEDWTPVARGFLAAPSGYVDDNDPFAGRNL